MGSQIAVPLWAVIIVAVLAALAVIDRILMPSVRWRCGAAPTAPSTNSIPASNFASSRSN